MPSQQNRHCYSHCSQLLNPLTKVQNIRYNNKPKCKILLHKIKSTEPSADATTIPSTPLSPSGTTSLVSSFCAKPLSVYTVLHDKDPRTKSILSLQYGQLKQSNL